MKAGIISPTPLLSEYSIYAHYHICYPDLILEDQSYLDFYLKMRARGDFIILDSSNGPIRRGIRNIVLWEAINLLKPSMVVAPDWDMNSGKTASLTLDFLGRYGDLLKEKRIQALGMVQGATLDQCLFVYKNIVKVVDTIGLPRSLEASIGRIKFLKRIRTTKPIHIFEIHRDLVLELKDILENGREIAGITSSLPVRLGLVCRNLEESWPEPISLDMKSDGNPFPEFTLRNVKDFIYLVEGNRID